MPTEQATKKAGARSKPARSTKSSSAKRGKVTDRRHATKQWSGEVTRKSDALDLEKGVFTSESPEKIARSLKHSAEASQRRKSDPFRSALSMLNFYVNRAGKNLSARRRHILAAASDRLHGLFGRKRKLPIKRVQ